MYKISIDSYFLENKIRLILNEYVAVQPNIHCQFVSDILNANFLQRNLARRATKLSFLQQMIDLKFSAKPIIRN
jgi:hypothetical protein